MQHNFFGRQLAMDLLTAILSFVWSRLARLGLVRDGFAQTFGLVPATVRRPAAPQVAVADRHAGANGVREPELGPDWSWMNVPSVYAAREDRFGGCRSRPGPNSNGDGELRPHLRD